MRRAAKVDKNQDQIVRTCLALGAVVQSLAGVGCGCPDLLVGYGGRNWLFEVKDPSASASDQALTEWQKKWHRYWRAQGGQVDVVMTPHDVALVLKGVKP